MHPTRDSYSFETLITDYKMIPLPLCADSQFVLKNAAAPYYLNVLFVYDPQNLRLKKTLQMSGTNATGIVSAAEGGDPMNMFVVGDISNFDPQLGLPVVTVVTMQKPGCTDDCISLLLEHVDIETEFIVSDMLKGTGSINVRAQLKWGNVRPSDELALFYKSLLAV